MSNQSLLRTFIDKTKWSQEDLIFGLKVIKHRFNDAAIRYNEGDLAIITFSAPDGRAKIGNDVAVTFQTFWVIGNSGICKNICVLIDDEILTDEIKTLYNDFII